MKNKKNMRRFLSGFLAMLTVLSTILSPILSYAADVVPVPEEPPLYEEVKNELDADEVVKAKDLELETGSIFEVEKDFTGLEIPDEKKVKITFHEAKNEEKQDFTTDYEDTYKAVYYVEPVSGHPIYQINRKLIVKEAVVQVAESENQESVSNQEDENEAEGEEPAIGTAESEEPVQDTVMGQGGNDSYKYVRYKADGKTYTVNAYCMQHSMQSPPSGTTYKNMVELDEGGDDKYLRKALFYGYGGPGWGHTFNGYNIKSIMEKYGCSSETRAMQHYLVDYLYDGESGFGGALSTTAKNMLKEIKAALAKMPDPTAMKLLPGLSVNATGKETESFTWKANEAFTITIHLENGVSLVNETTGKTASGNVTVKGGEKFHLVATTANMGSLKGKYAITSNFPLDFHAIFYMKEGL